MEMLKTIRAGRPGADVRRCPQLGHPRTHRRETNVLAEIFGTGTLHRRRLRRRRRRRAGLRPEADGDASTRPRPASARRLTRRQRQRSTKRAGPRARLASYVRSRQVARATPPRSASRPAATPTSSTSPSEVAARRSRESGVADGPGERLRPRLDRGDDDDGVRARRRPRPAGAARPPDPGRGRLRAQPAQPRHQLARPPARLADRLLARSSRWSTAGSALGTWQQLVLIDFDDRPRERTVVVQVVG